MRTLLAGLAAVLAWAPSSLADEPLRPEARAGYCLRVLDMHDSLSSQSRSPSDVDRMLGSTAAQREANRKRLEAYLAARALSPAEAEGLRKAYSSLLAQDTTEMIFTTPDPKCRQPTAGLCRVEAFAKSAPAARQVSCTGPLDWLDR